MISPTPLLGARSLDYRSTIASKKLEHGCRMIYASFSFFLWFGVGGWSGSNFLASTVPSTQLLRLLI